MAVLELQHISKSYGRIQALRDLSFDVPEGSVFGVLGPNGSGKTTLLSIILDVLSADSGKFLWFGQPGSPGMRKQIGSLLETPNFYHYMSGINNLRITQSISGRGNLENINEVLQKVNLLERKKSKFSSYSLGMKQRLAIGAALLGNPRVLVLDEPTNGLDPVGIAEIRELIRELNGKGFTIIMASHLLDEVEKICTHVAILKKGELVTQGSVDEVLVDEDIIEISCSQPDRLEQVLANYNGSTQLKKDGKYLYLYFPKGSALPEEINRYCFEQGITIDHLLHKKKRLEARFFELTGN